MIKAYLGEVEDLMLKPQMNSRYDGEIEITEDLTIPKLFAQPSAEIRGQKSGHAGEGVRYLAAHHLARITWTESGESLSGHGESRA